MVGVETPHPNHPLRSAEGVVTVTPLATASSALTDSKPSSDNCGEPAVGKGIGIEVVETFRAWTV